MEEENQQEQESVVEDSPLLNRDRVATQKDVEKQIEEMPNTVSDGEEETPESTVTESSRPADWSAEHVIPDTGEGEATSPKTINEDDGLGTMAAKGAATVLEAAGRNPFITGAVRGVEDVYNFASWVGDKLEKVTGLEYLVKNTLGGDGLFSDDPNFGKGAVSQYMYQSDTTLGQLAEEGARFGVGMVAGGPAAKGLQGVANVAFRGAKYVPYVQKVKNIQQITEGFKSLMANPTMQAFNQGSARGAVADFALTGQEDDLLSDFILNLKPGIQNVYIDSVMNNDPPSLFMKKLQAVGEGYLLGGVGGVVLDDVFTILQRARQNGVFSVFGDTAEEATEKRLQREADNLAKQTERKAAAKEKRTQKSAAKKAEKAKSKAEGKTYNGKKVVKVKDKDGFDVFTTEDLVDPQRPGYIYKGQEGLLPADAESLLDLDGIDAGIDITKSVDAVRRTYDQVGANKVKSSNVELQTILDDKTISQLDKTKALIEAEPSILFKALRTDEAFRNKRALKKESLTLSDLDEFKDTWGFNDVAELEKLWPGTSAEDIAAYFYKAEASLHRVNEYALANLERIKNLDPEALAEFKEISDMAGEFVADYMNRGRTAGQALRFYGLYKNAMSDKLRSTLIQGKLKGMDTTELVKNLDNIVNSNPSLKTKPNEQIYLNMSTSKKFIEAMATIYPSNLLWGIPTQVFNWGSGAIMGFYKLAGRAVVADLSTNSASAAGAKAYLRKLIDVTTYGSAFKEAGKAFVNAQVPPHLLSARQAQKIDIQFRLFNEMAQQNKHRPILQGFLMGIDALTSTPGRALNAGDTFFKQVGFTAGWAEGLAEATVKNGLTEAQGLELAAKVGTRDFSGMPPELNLKALDARINNDISEITYTNKSGPFMSKIHDLIDYEFHGVRPLKFIAPFARVDANIIGYTISNTPLIHKMSPATANIFKYGTVEQQERKIAEMMMASGTIMMGGVLVAEGLMTGKGPQDPREKAQLLRTGWKPYSVKIPGHGYVEMKRLGAVGNFLTIGVLSKDILENLDENDDHTAAQAVAGVLSMVSDAFTPNFISQSIPEFLQIIQAEGDSRGSAYEKAMELVGRIGSEATIPGSGIYSRNTMFFGKGQNMNEVDYDEDTFLRMFKKTFPDIDTDLRPQVDLFGEDRSRNPLLPSANMDLSLEYERIADSGFVDTDERGVEKSLLFMAPRRWMEDTVLGERVRTYKLSNDEFYRLQKYSAGVMEGSGFPQPFGKTFAQLWRDEMKAGYPSVKQRYGSTEDQAVITWLREQKDVYNEVARNIIKSERQVMQGRAEGKQELFKQRQDMLQGTSVRRR